MKQIKGIGKVFQFTLAQQLKTKSYVALTTVVLILCLMLPAGIMSLVEVIGSSEEETVPPALETVYVVDRTKEEPVSLSVLNQLKKKDFSDLVYEDAGTDVETALELAAGNAYSLVLVMDKTDDGYTMNVLTPENSLLTDTDTDGLCEVVNSGFSLVLMQKSGLSAAQLLQMSIPTTTEIAEVEEGEVESEEEDAMELLKMVLGLILPFLNIMILYFLVLMYGQSIGNNVIIEKTSKLMDTFLVSVKPGALIFGKVLAITLSSILQFSLWAAAVIVSFAVGSVLVRTINPDTEMVLLQIFDSLSLFSGLFSVSGIILALFMVFGGFLLYCSIAAIGGALAGKPEDLSSTNALFVLILLISFFCTLYAGGIEGLGMGSGNSGWLDWVPFTAIMITPSRILLGEVSLIKGIGSLLIVILTSGLILAIAGKIYRMLSFFRGDVPKIGKLLKLLKEK
ncbi:MAG: ABC transporter permease [Lachnospiraceae bacterium]|nr:ABC transporter permease [Lachnospiraceae bacterium]